ncbi:hypothetical protein G3R49_15000 [Shewanella sp. WXL01]|uniref:hypothetical protein n=1 Tax=Shewanella sp. WXL01 TaxID=2709721 RepID=UPI0014384755|nr:hypothetical protein [Shewanella sp. WXL01]NKF51870.1 hypothetical protein [Shewanella sp. WXL01]
MTVPKPLIESFVAQWFKRFDVLPDDSAWFKQFLADDLRLAMPEGEFVGPDGFDAWYQIARSNFKPNCLHLVKQIDVKLGENEGEHKVSLIIHLEAQTYETSQFKGEVLELDVAEYWRLTLDDKGQIKLHDYQVMPL